MTLRKPHNIKKVTSEEATMLNENYDRLFQSKLESRFYTSGSDTFIKNYQSMELFRFTASANGSPTTVITVPLKAVHDQVLFAQANAISPLMFAHVTDVTNTSIEVSVRSISGTANFSAVTTATISIQLQVIGSQP